MKHNYGLIPNFDDEPVTIPTLTPIQSRSGTLTASPISSPERARLERARTTSSSSILAHGNGDTSVTGISKDVRAITTTGVGVARATLLPAISTPTRSERMEHHRVNHFTEFAEIASGSRSVRVDGRRLPPISDTFLTPSVPMPAIRSLSSPMIPHRDNSDKLPAIFEDEDEIGHVINSQGRLCNRHGHVIHEYPRTVPELKKLINDVKYFGISIEENVETIHDYRRLLDIVIKYQSILSYEDGMNSDIDTHGSPNFQFRTNVGNRGLFSRTGTPNEDE